MSEVSREEAIKELEFCKDMILFNPNTGETYTVDYIESVNDDNARLYKACDKAIADMVKLQKIEEIINLCNNPCKDCRFFGENGRECIFLKHDEIEKIVRGE